MTNPVIARGATGFVVESLQKALGNLKIDGDFGGKTEERVIETQSALGLQATGRADAQLFSSIGLTFPDEFKRCLQLTGAYEGTGFGGVNRRDIDGAGVTLGIVGFTTKHGEVQELISNYIAKKPAALHGVSSLMRDKLIELCKDSRRNVDKWNAWFYGRDGVVDRWILDLVQAWGADPIFRELQLSMIYDSMWLPVERTARNLGLTSTRAKAFLFDCQVQNGGFGSRHLKHCNELSSYPSEQSRLRAMAHAVAKDAIPRWREDTLARKLTFVNGHGVVHQRRYDIEDFGL